MTATAPVNIGDLKREPNPRETRLPSITPGFDDLQSFELLQRIAKLFTASPLVPAQYQGAEGLPSMVIALNMAHRMQADPLMICQNLYIVHGRPAWSAQFLIAAFNRCGRYSALRYEWQGQRGSKDWGCRAWAVERETGEKVYGPLVTMATAESEGWTKRSGSKWLTIPELMLTYRAAAWLVRTNAPEIAMGLPTAEEVADVVTLSPEEYTVAEVAAGDHAKEKKRGKAEKDADPPFALDGTPPPGPTYAEVRESLEKARDGDALDVAESLVDSLPANFRAELHELAKTRRATVGAA